MVLCSQGVLDHLDLVCLCLSICVCLSLAQSVATKHIFLLLFVCLYMCVSASITYFYFIYIIIVIAIVIAQHHWFRSFRKTIRDFHNRIASTNTAETKTIFYSLFFFLLLFFVCLFGGLIGGAVITVHETIINDQRILCLLSVNRIERRISISSCVISLFYFILFFFLHKNWDAILWGKRRAQRRELVLNFSVSTDRHVLLGRVVDSLFLWWKGGAPNTRLPFYSLMLIMCGSRTSFAPSES